MTSEEPLYVLANTDELIDQIRQDEMQDALASGQATPINYARARSVSPQMVYYHIRRGVLKSSWCACGRKVVDVAEADAIFFPEAEEETSE